MSEKTLRVVARLTAKPGKDAGLASILENLVAPTRKEKGCIRYELLRNNADAHEFVFVEEWTDDAALDAHLSTPHLTDALGKAKPLLATNPVVGRYSVVK